jgi:hypothetical protein
MEPPHHAVCSFKQLDLMSAALIEGCGSEISAEEVEAFYRTQQRLASIYLKNCTLASREGLPVMPILNFIALREANLTQDDVTDLKDLGFLLQQVIKTTEERWQQMPNHNKVHRKRVTFASDHEQFLICTIKPSLEEP